MIRSINQVFGYTPIGRGETETRAFYPRVDYEKRLEDLLISAGVLIISGYSGIGKTTILEQALDLGNNRFRRETRYRRKVRLGASEFVRDRERGLTVPDTIYRQIREGLPLNLQEDKPSELSDYKLSERVHFSNSIFIIENFQTLDIEIGEQLYSLLKSWAEWKPDAGANVPQSKIVLVAPAPSPLIDNWLRQVSQRSRARLSPRYLNVEPWSYNELLKILRNGAHKLGVDFQAEVEEAIIRFACGNPLALNALAHQATLRANQYHDDIIGDTLKVGSMDLDGVIQNADEIRRAIMPQTPPISNDAYLQMLIGYLATRGGQSPIEDIRFEDNLANPSPQELESFASENAEWLFTYEDLRGQYLALRELSSGTLAFLNLALKRYMEATPSPTKERIEALLFRSNEIVTGEERSTVFISYSHQDAEFLEELKTQLGSLVAQGKLDIWDDTQIKPGSNWRRDIDRALKSAKVGVLLVTPNFLNSEFIRNNELPQLLAASEQEGLVVFPIAVRSSMFKQTGLRDYQFANNPDKPMGTMNRSARDKTWVSVCEKIIAAATT